MYNPTSYIIEACIEHLQQTYTYLYGQLEPEYPKILDGRQNVL